MDILEKFLALTERAQSFGNEDDMRVFLPEGIKQDSANNYYLEIGNSRSMFTAHLDTVSDYGIQAVNQIIEETPVGKIVKTDGNSILGADDKTGVLLLLYMIEKQIPGLYYFFVGEECGRIGSKDIAYSNPEFFTPYRNCISFDRRGYSSVITHQSGDRTCSDVFATTVAEDLSELVGGAFSPDANGSFTDSYSFNHLIENCTNISVGYFRAHTYSEYQDITFLEKLCDAVCHIDWEAINERGQWELSA